MKNRNIIFLTIILIFGFNVNAQEYLSGFEYGKTEKRNEAEKNRSGKDLSLPFFDDFTESELFPDASKWKNRSVLINSGFPAFPTNYNAATFDALDETGKVYGHASSTPFVADSLMSNHIDLRDFSPEESLYLSFYYQPQGNGDAPETNDSLVLMFGYETDTFRIEYVNVSIKDMLDYMNVDTIKVGDILYHDMYSSCNQDMFAISEHQYTAADSMKTVELPCDTVFYSEMVWNHIWSSPGMTLDSFLLANNGNHFKQVMIPVVDENYFKNGLTLLFYNYASLPMAMYPNDRSNVDNWNIDFVYLDVNRSSADTTYPLVTFSEKSPSLLRRYQSMPYKQYKSNPTAAMTADYQMFIANLDSASHKIQYTCNIENLTSGWTFDYSSAWCNVSPFATNGFQNCEGSNATQACPHLNNFLFDMDDKVDTTSYLITHILKIDNDTTDVKGDTLYGRQGFYNYYAYDDGTPERGYGVVPDDSYFATQFTISTPDTLCGVNLLFNRTHNDANYDFFDIVVWNDNNGMPGNEFYRLKNQRPEWSDTIYKFAYYPFDKVLKVNGTIYVGIMQHSKESINIGFDTSNDNSQYNFFETGGGWENSSMPGSLMIRPVLGADYVIEKDDNDQRNDLGLYPVPSKDEVNISKLSSDSCDEVMIFDMTGRVMKSYRNSAKLDVSDLSNGLYMIRVLTEEGKIYTEKFLIVK